MTQPLIDISADQSKPEGGHAIVLVRDITEMPDPLQFRISALPDDPDDAESTTEWSLGEHKPIAAGLTPDGLVMKIGPVVVDAPELQPGTPVVFALTSASVSVELSWPDLPVTIPASLPAPLMDPSELRAHKMASANHDAAQATADEADRARHNIETCTNKRQAAKGCQPRRHIRCPRPDRACRRLEN